VANSIAAVIFGAVRFGCLVDCRGADLDDDESLRKNGELHGVWSKIRAKKVLDRVFFYATAGGKNMSKKTK